jgi:hypothetical protein
MNKIQYHGTTTQSAPEVSTEIQTYKVQVLSEMSTGNLKQNYKETCFWYFDTHYTSKENFFYKECMTLCTQFILSIFKLNVQKE